MGTKQLKIHLSVCHQVTREDYFSLHIGNTGCWPRQSGRTNMLAQNAQHGQRIYRPIDLLFDRLGYLLRHCALLQHLAYAAHKVNVIVGKFGAVAEALVLESCFNIIQVRASAASLS